MKWVCAGPHAYVDMNGYKAKRESWPCESLGAYLFHRISHSHRLTMRLWRMGFVDSLTEGGEAFLRWDFWNSCEMAELRRRRAERAREAA